MPSKFLPTLFAALILVTVACSHTAKNLPLEQIPAGNSQVITVNKAYDYIYLSVFDAVNALKNWMPEKTLKDEGLIRLQNTQFGRFDDSSNRVIDLRIHRDSAAQTSVYLDENSRSVVGADAVLAAIRQKLESLPA